MTRRPLLLAALAALVLVGSSIATPRQAPLPSGPGPVVDRFIGRVGETPGGAPHVSDRGGTPPVNGVAAATPITGGAPHLNALYAHRSPLAHRARLGIAPQSRPALTTDSAAEPYQSAIGTALLGGYATWYRDPSQPPDGLYAAAGPALREALGNWRGVVLRVQSGRSWTMATIRDACWCVDRRGRPTLLDLSPTAMLALAPDYERLGVVAVSVEWLPDALPATETR
jgi:hypothetical protein